MRPLAALTAAPRSVGEAAFHGPVWVDARIVPGLVPPPTPLFVAVVDQVPLARPLALPRSHVGITALVANGASPHLQGHGGDGSSSCASATRRSPRHRTARQTHAGIFRSG